MPARARPTRSSPSYPAPPRDRAVRRGLAALAAAGLALVLAAPPAQAHTVLLSSDPAAGSTVPVMPEMVSLTFNEPLLAVGTQIMVHTADQTMVNIGPPIFVDNTVSQAVTGELPAGEYTVLYRVTSADGHPIEDQYTFTAAGATSYGVATPAPGPSSTPTPTPTATQTPTPSPSATATTPPQEGRVSPAALIGVAAAFVMGGGVVAWLLLRRRSAPQ